MMGGRLTGCPRRGGGGGARRGPTRGAPRGAHRPRDVATVREPLQEKFLSAQKDVIEEAKKLHATDPERARAYLTHVTRKACTEATEAYWNLGDMLWTKYDEKW
jgi:dipeptidase